MTTKVSDDLNCVEDEGDLELILQLVSRSAGLGFCAIARVSEKAWTPYRIHDAISFGITAGKSIAISGLPCEQVLKTRKPLVIADARKWRQGARDTRSAFPPFRVFVSAPVFGRDGRIIATLCAADRKAVPLRAGDIAELFTMYARLVSIHLEWNDRVDDTRGMLTKEQSVAEFRDQFIAVIGHDLRNPLASIKAGIRLLMTRGGREDDLRILLLMQRAIDRSVSLVDTVTEYTRASLGGGIKLRIDPDESISETLQQVVDEMQAMEPDRVIESHIQISVPVKVDHARIARLLSNLVGNALTYGSPYSAVRVAASTEGGNFELSVANKDDPIDPEILPRLFEPFVRDSSHDGEGSEQSLGLGLFIASEIARAHGGSLSVSSDERETVFRFRMPIRLQPQKRADANETV